MDYQKNNDGSRADTCNFYQLISFLSKKRVMLILLMLADGEDRFSGLQKKLPHMNSKILMERLDELCKYNYVQKNMLSEKPRRIRYILGNKGKEIVRCLEQLCNI